MCIVSYLISASLAVYDWPDHRAQDQYHHTMDSEPQALSADDSSGERALPAISTASQPWNPEFGDVKTEYHPNSGLEPKTERFEDYMQNRPPPVIPESEPWKPFRSRLDFEVSELILEAALNRSQADRLIKLIHRAAENNDHDPFTLQNGADMNKMWEYASVHQTQVSFSLQKILLVLTIYVLKVCEERVYCPIQKSAKNI